MPIRTPVRSLAAAAALAVATLPAMAHAESITVMIWGTTWKMAFQQIAHDFTDKTGIDVKLVTQTNSGESLAKLQAQRGHPGVDVWFTTSSVASRAVKDEGLFDEIPLSDMPNTADMIKGAANKGWVAAYAYPLGIIYRPDMVKGKITSWEDLWKPEFENKLAIPSPSTYQARMLLVAAQLAGGSIDDVDPGIDKLKALDPNVAFWYTSDAQARQALVNGEVSVLVSPPSGAKAVRAEGVDVTMVSPKPAPMLYDVMTMVKNGHEDAAAEFIDYAVSPEAQQIMANNLQNMPVNVKAKVPEALAGQYPKPEDTVTYDEDKVNANYDDWNQKFQLSVAQ